MLATLGVAEDLGEEPVDAVARVIGGLTALEVEESLHARGGLAVAARGPQDWAMSEQGVLAAGQPLLTTARIDEAPERMLGGGGLPCARLRVLDLTRMLAGPVECWCCSAPTCCGLTPHNWDPVNWARPPGRWGINAPAWDREY
ncbi:hypothetical protein [Streptomyces sp. NPDC055099]